MPGNGLWEIWPACLRDDCYAVTSVNGRLCFSHVKIELTFVKGLINYEEKSQYMNQYLGSNETKHFKSYETCILIVFVLNR